MEIKTRQMTLIGQTTFEGFVILESGEKIFASFNRNKRSEAVADAKRLARELKANQ